MRTTSLLRGRGARLLVYLGAAVGLGGGVVGWWGGTTSPPHHLTTSPVAVAQSQPTSRHSTGKVHFDVLAKLLADDRRTAPANAWLRELADPKEFRAETQVHPLLQHAALDFTLEDHRGQRWSLQGQLGRGPIVLVFYLGYACNACVHDLFELNADLERFHSLGAEVVAVSGDTPGLTRQRFEQYGAFGFPVLSDPGHEVALSYGTFRPAKASKPEELRHGTFLIGREGQVHWVRCGDIPFRNNKALLYELARLENKLPQPEATRGVVGKERKTP